MSPEEGIQTESDTGTSNQDYESNFSEDEDLHVDSNTTDICSWTFKYDKNLYTTGIAVQKLNRSDLTLLQWLALNFNFFCSHPSMSKEAFTDTLRLHALTAL